MLQLIVKPGSGEVVMSHRGGLTNRLLTLTMILQVLHIIQPYIEVLGSLQKSWFWEKSPT